jgi:hypothetical protein
LLIAIFWGKRLSKSILGENVIFVLIDKKIKSFLFILEEELGRKWEI